MKQLLLKLLFHSGLLPAWHRRRNRHTLTVLIYHRVFPFDTAAPCSQWPGYAVTPRHLEQSIAFLRRYYHVVSLREVLDARNGGPPLPPCALLITIDDGWHDTAEFAEPVLRRENCPALLFAVGSLGDGTELWQESLYREFHSGRLTAGVCLSLWNAAGGEARPPEAWNHLDALWRLMARLQTLTPERRLECLAQAGLALPAPGVMMTDQELKLFARPPMAVGAHGLTHLPLTFAPDPASELSLSRARLRQLLAGASEVETMSWPHGRYNPELTRQALAAGYQCLFTSDQVLNRTSAGRPPRLLGRFEPAMGDVAGREGNLLPEKLANLLFRLPLADLEDRP